MAGRWRANANLAASALVAALAIAGYARLYYSVSVLDEAFMVTLAYLPALGGRWFVNDNSMIQTGSILFSPFVLAYGALFGTRGMILFVRHLHFALSLFVSHQTYKCLRHFNPFATALLLSSVVFAFVPHQIATLSYNTLGSLLFGLGGALGTRALIERRRGLATAGGLAWAAATFAYPTMVFPLVSFLLVAAGLAARAPWRRRILFWPFALAISAAGALAALGLLGCGWDNLREMYLWTRDVARAGSLAKLGYSWTLAGAYLPPWHLAPALFLAALTVAPFRAGWAAAASGAFVAAYFAFAGKVEAAPTQVVWPYLEAFALVALSQRRFRPRGQDAWLLGLMVAPAVLGSLLTCLTSRVSLYAMAIPGVFGGIASLALVFGRTRVVGPLCAGVLALASVAWHWGDMYEDGPLSTLTYRVPRGPFAGLLTFPEKGAWIERVESAIEGIRDKRIIVKDGFPAGYLMGRNRVWGPIVYFGPAIWYPDLRPRYREVFADRKNWPDVVVDLRYYPAAPGKFWPYNVSGFEGPPDPFRRFFQTSGAFATTVSTADLEVLERSGAPAR